jgi:hypothetical protein
MFESMKLQKRRVIIVAIQIAEEEVKGRIDEENWPFGFWGFSQAEAELTKMANDATTQGELFELVKAWAKTKLESW